jgi:hypothetical protein
LPRLYQTAVSELISTERELPSYQFTTMLSQAVSGRSSRLFSVGRRWPLCEAAPVVPDA